ncbi:hypothetical protein PFISCL1PPCAC_28340, partial [Pristionchus fissidentatus]
DPLIEDRELGNSSVDLTLHPDDSKINIFKSWLLKMPKIKEISVFCETISNSNPDPFDDAFLSHLAKQASILNLNAISGSYSNHGVSSIFEAFRAGSLDRALLMATPESVALFKARNENCRVIFNEESELVVFISKKMLE